MDNTVYISSLYDCYGSLLTEVQRNYFEDYYFQNLTCQEIGDNRKVTRNAVNKQIKDAVMKLEFYEEKLNMYVKATKIERAINKINDDKIKEEIKEIIWE